MKRLILCCDGTWNKPDEEKNGRPIPTNVVRLAYRVAKRDGAVPQITYYDMGVGTGNVIDRLAGGVLGEGLEGNIHDAYRFLIGNYELGDEIYLFGFSRGAFTARSIGGMVRKCGILRRGAVDKYREAKDLYHSSVHPDDAPAVAFRKVNSLSPDEPIKIRFIGVWDTVGSLGIPKKGGVAKELQFHDTELSGTVAETAGECMFICKLLLSITVSRRMVAGRYHFTTYSTDYWLLARGCGLIAP